MTLDPTVWQGKPWRTPAMEKCRRATREAVKRGDLHKPETCERCGVIPPLTALGYSGIQAHHHDYSKPMDVEWLCAKCHRAVTPLPAVMGAPSCGEDNVNAKLTAAMVREIRSSYTPGVYGYMRLAKKYGVSLSTMKQVVRNETWKTVS